MERGGGEVYINRLRALVSVSSNIIHHASRSGPLETAELSDEDGVHASNLAHALYRYAFVHAVNPLRLGTEAGRGNVVVQLEEPEGRSVFVE